MKTFIFVALFALCALTMAAPAEEPKSEAPKDLDAAPLFHLGFYHGYGHHHGFHHGGYHHGFHRGFGFYG